VLKFNSNYGKAKNVFVPSAGGAGIATSGTNVTIASCTVRSTGGSAISLDANQCIVKNCTVEDSGLQGIITDGVDDCIVSNNIIINSSNNGIYNRNSSNDGIYIGNRIMGSGSDGLRFSGTDNIGANNRISGSSGSNIADKGKNTTLDGNLTGPAN